MSDEDVNLDKDDQPANISSKQNGEYSTDGNRNSRNIGQNRNAENRPSMQLFEKRERHGMLWLLIWKNFVLQKRRPKGSFFEIFLPIFFGLILVLIRTQVEVDITATPTVFPLVLIMICCRVLSSEKYAVIIFI